MVSLYQYPRSHLQLYFLSNIKRERVVLPRSIFWISMNPVSPSSFRTFRPVREFVLALIRRQFSQASLPFSSSFHTSNISILNLFVFPMVLSPILEKPTPVTGLIISFPFLQRKYTQSVCDRKTEIRLP